jgi:hypothetical protein
VVDAINTAGPEKNGIGLFLHLILTDDLINKIHHIYWLSLAQKIGDKNGSGLLYPHLKFSRLSRDRQEKMTRVKFDNVSLFCLSPPLSPPTTWGQTLSLFSHLLYYGSNRIASLSLLPFFLSLPPDLSPLLLLLLWIPHRRRLGLARWAPHHGSRVEEGELTTRTSARFYGLVSWVHYQLVYWSFLLLGKLCRFHWSFGVVGWAM